MFSTCTHLIYVKIIAATSKVIVLGVYGKGGGGFLEVDQQGWRMRWVETTRVRTRITGSISRAITIPRRDVVLLAEDVT